MHPLSRRSFLKASAYGAAALSLSRAGLAAAPAGKPGFRLFACDWTMKKTSDPGSFALAKSLGLDGVQVDFGRLAPGESRPPLLAPAHQDRILAASRETGVAIASLAFGVLNSIPYKSAPETESWVLDGLPVAKKLGVSVILLAFFSKNDLVDDPAGIQETIRRLKRIAPRAADLGVTLGLESWLKVDALEPILAAVNSPAVQVYYDVGNLHKVGEDYGAAIRRLGRERICEIHLKDYDNLYGKGSIDFPAVRAACDAIGYRGWLGIEGTQLPLGLEASLKYDVDYLRPLFPPTLPS